MGIRPEVKWNSAGNRTAISRKPVVVIGGGQVGRRAVKRLTDLGFDRITVVDPEPQSLAGWPPGVETVSQDGVRWLEQTGLGLARLRPWIIPAAPVHLAFQWLLGRLGQRARQVPAPQDLLAGLPGLTPAAGGGWLLSWSQEICPADCDERGVCPRLGRRLEPLYGLLRRRARTGLLAVVRSHPLGPGLGGFSAGSLVRLLRQIEGQKGLVSVATACRCFGVVHALELNQGGDDGT